MKLGRNVKIEPTVRIQNPESVDIGDHSYIDDFVKLEGNIHIGKRCHICEHVMLQGGYLVDISDYVAISAGSKVYSVTETYASGKHMSSSRVPRNLRDVKGGAVTIEKDCFVGLNSVIMPGVTMHEGSVLGVLSMLKAGTEVPPYEIWVGIPARKIGVRPRLVVPDPPEDW